MKFHIWIIGCQYNEWDGARLSFLMQKLGFVESEPDDADVIMVLACSVRQTAIDRILGRVKNWQPKDKLKNSSTKALKNNSRINQPTNQPIDQLTKKLILLSGCVLESDRPKFAKKGIGIFESGNFEQLINILATKFDIKQPTAYPEGASNSRGNLPPTTCYVPIMVGCNNFCSYCAVPYTRGREKSRPVDEVIADVQELVKKGHKEIMLLGQNVNSFRITNHESRIKNNKNNKSDFTVLLEKLNALGGDFVISFTSNHPKDMTDDIIAAVATLPKIKKQLHLPLQSGSDKILKLMNRPYSVKQYLDLIENCKLKIDNLVITTDVIVGFPGETGEDFQKTVEVFKQVDYDVAYVNKYSPRAGTAAFELGDPISWSEKKRRWKILDEIVYKK